jgi:hypothetical protein
MRNLFLLAGASAFLVSCFATESQLRTRAAFDMNCDAQALQIVKIDSRTRGVVGCGKRMTYVETTGRMWVLNTDGKPCSEK